MVVKCTVLWLLYALNTLRLIFPRLAAGRITFPRLTTCCAWQSLHVSSRSGAIHVFASGSLSYCGLFASFEISDVFTLFLDSHAKCSIFLC